VKRPRGHRVKQLPFCLTLIGRKRQNEGKQLSVWIFIVLNKMARKI